MRRVFQCLLCAVLLLMTANARSSAAEKEYPTLPIRLIVPFAPGGGTDIVARAIAQELSKKLKQQVFIDNRAGAGGAAGSEAVVRASPDGYTLIFGAASYATNAATYDLPYDPVKDITPIALVCSTGYLVVLNPSLGIKSTNELISYAKEHPGKLNYGSSGAGGLSHLGGVLFDMMAGTKMVHVPYRGTGPALVDLLGGQVQLMLGSMPTLVPYVESKKLTAIAVTTPERVASLPNIPTVSETLPGYDVTLWYGVWGPKGLPPQIVEKLNSEIASVIEMPDVKALMARDGLVPVGGPPENLRRVLSRDIETWTKVAREAGLKEQAKSK